MAVESCALTARIDSLEIVARGRTKRQSLKRPGDRTNAQVRFASYGATSNLQCCEEIGRLRRGGSSGFARL